MTASAALIPLAAASAQFIARGVADALEQGTSFVKTLLAAGEQSPSSDDDADAAATDETIGLTNSSRMVRWQTAQPNLKAQTAAIHQLLMEKLAAKGINLSEPVTLRTDADGRVLVDTAHPDRPAIEQLFESDRTLASQFRQLVEQVASLQRPAGDEEAPDASGVRLIVSRDEAVFTSE